MRSARIIGACGRRVRRSRCEASFAPGSAAAAGIAHIAASAAAIVKPAAIVNPDVINLAIKVPVR
jgi:hypothetical protein